MKILINFLSVQSGGAVSYLKNLLQPIQYSLDRSSDDHSIKILIYSDQMAWIPFWPDDQAVIVPGGYKSGVRRLIWEHQNINHILEEHQIDVLFTPYQVGTKVKTAKHVMMLRNMEPFNFQKYRYSLNTFIRNHLLKLQTTYSLRSADKVIAVSGYAKDLALKKLKISDSNIRQIYHGRDLQFHPDDISGNDIKRIERLGVKNEFILTCGSLLPYRRCEDVVRAFSKFASQYDQLHLVIAGSGNDKDYNQKIERIINQSQLPDRIHRVGHVPVETMQSLYRKCRFCVISTEIEACPNIVIEAMASGCICISSDHAPLPEMFKGSAIQYKSRNIEELVDKMKICLSNENLRKELKEKSLQRAMDFSWEVCATETLKALTQW